MVIALDSDLQIQIWNLKMRFDLALISDLVCHLYR